MNTPVQASILAEFGAALGELCARTPLAPGRSLRWAVIANPRAGGFTMRSRWTRHAQALRLRLDESRERLLLRPGAAAAPAARREGGENGLVATTGPGHAGRLAQRIIDEAEGEAGAGGCADDNFYLFVTAGGDGTSREVLTALYHARERFRSRCAILRLPLGTGNDGADARDLAGALRLLTGPVEVTLTRALLLTTSSASAPGPFLAFNILSVGLDAFVTHMTNRMKTTLPGDSYKLWVDLAALFYDRLYRVEPMGVRARGEDGEEVFAYDGKVLLLAVGASGRRTYGSQKRILPDDRNVCLLKQMSLLRKLALKDLFNTGGHVDKPEALLFNARRVEFSYAAPLLAQMDGETVLLGPGDFPAAITLSPPVIPALTLA